MHRINITLVCFLVFTIISSALAYKIVISGYASYGESPDDKYSLERLERNDKPSPQIKNTKDKEE